MDAAPQSAVAHNDLAWLLATCADTALRNPKRAVELAAKAVELAPTEGMVWNTLGAARYRGREWSTAIEALNRSMELRQGGDAFDYFFLAMAHWQLDHKDEALKWYEKAVRWVQTNEEALKNDTMHKEELARFRAEAHELLGVSGP